VNNWGENLRPGLEWSRPPWNVTSLADALPRKGWARPFHLRSVFGFAGRSWGSKRRADTRPTPAGGFEFSLIHMFMRSGAPASAGGWGPQCFLELTGFTALVKPANEGHWRPVDASASLPQFPVPRGQDVAAQHQVADGMGDHAVPQVLGPVRQAVEEGAIDG